MNTICVIGLGYIGLPTAAILASRGKQVIGVDIDQKAVDTINAGAIHITEPDLDGLVQTVVGSGKLTCQTKPSQADAYVIAVPTPFKDKYEPDLSFVQSAAESIAPYLGKGNLIVLESTSPVGTTEEMVKWLSVLRPDLSFPKDREDHADVFVAYCPERVLPGRILTELVSNDRLVGGISTACSSKAISLYSSFVEGDCVATNARTAEMAKLTENSFRDVNIAFANELSLICDKLDIDTWELIRLANRHPRVNILNPGPGVGGHCIAVDPWFIVSRTPDEALLIRTAREVNDHKPEWVVEEIKRKAGEWQIQKGEAPTIACYGIAFKPNIDDLRQSPSLEIARKIVDAKLGSVMICEPNIDALPNDLVSIELCNFRDAIKTADIHVLLVGHEQFGEVEFSGLKDDTVLDFCGVLSK